MKHVIEGYKKETSDGYYESNKEMIDEVTSSYLLLKDLREKKYILKSYLTKLENSLTEEDKDYTDENDIRYGSLLKAYETIHDKISFYEEKLKNFDNEINNLIKFNILKDLTQNVLTAKYKYQNCEFDFSNFKCKGSKESSSRWKYKNLGYL